MSDREEFFKKKMADVFVVGCAVAFVLLILTFFTGNSYAISMGIIFIIVSIGVATLAILYHLGEIKEAIEKGAAKK